MQYRSGPVIAFIITNVVSLIIFSLSLKKSRKDAETLRKEEFIITSHPFRVEDYSKVQKSSRIIICCL
jgi:hypothetical protein